MVKYLILTIALLFIINLTALSMNDGDRDRDRNSSSPPKNIPINNIDPSGFPSSTPFVTPSLISVLVQISENDNFNDDKISQVQSLPIETNHSYKKEEPSEEDKNFLNLESLLENLPSLVDPDKKEEPLEEEVTVSKYNSENEYSQHQQASDRFFKRPSRKRDLIREARNRVLNQTNIQLDGLSSRTRILMFRELTAFACTHNITSIFFMFHGKKFKINLTPSLRQPGDGIISAIGKHNKIYEILHNLTPEYQKKIAEKLIKARRKREPYHPNIDNPIIKLDGKKLNLEILNILLDFEVARRLQKTVDKDQDTLVKSNIKNNKEVNLKNAKMEYKNSNSRWSLDQVISWMNSDRSFLDSIPVASAIVGALKLSSKDPVCDLLLMPELPENKALVRGKMYLEKNDEQLNYVVMKPNGKIVEKIFNININQRKYFWGIEYIPNRELTPEVLKEFKSEILGEASRRNHIENPELLEIFFHAPDNDSNGYRAGNFSAFEGRPDGGRRKRAAERIIKKLRGGDHAQNSTLEEIHREYLDIFGGDSESEGDAY